ncbi:hypothetical protein PUN28_002964 [Cardiocondyla obscurior]|uniref:MADS-box domain-containing protein n=1 Tax=Cardiocondyla obscurior TaxID=286306 RepID=A0AAW2GWT8_9HYME
MSFNILVRLIRKRKIAHLNDRSVDKCRDVSVRCSYQLKFYLLDTRRSPMPIPASSKKKKKSYMSTSLSVDLPHTATSQIRYLNSTRSLLFFND